MAPPPKKGAEKKSKNKSKDVSAKKLSAQRKRVDDVREKHGDEMPETHPDDTNAMLVGRAQVGGTEVKVYCKVFEDIETSHHEVKLFYTEHGANTAIAKKELTHVCDYLSTSRMTSSGDHLKDEKAFNALVVLCMQDLQPENKRVNRLVQSRLKGLEIGGGKKISSGQFDSETQGGGSSTANTPKRESFPEPTPTSRIRAPASSSFKTHFISQPFISDLVFEHSPLYHWVTDCDLTIMLLISPTLSNKLTAQELGLLRGLEESIKGEEHKYPVLNVPGSMWKFWCALAIQIAQELNVAQFDVLWLLRNNEEMKGKSPEYVIEQARVHSITCDMQRLAMREVSRSEGDAKVAAVPENDVTQMAYRTRCIMESLEALDSGRGDRNFVDEDKALLQHICAKGKDSALRTMREFKEAALHNVIEEQRPRLDKVRRRIYEYLKDWEASEDPFLARLSAEFKAQDQPLPAGLVDVLHRILEERKPKLPANLAEEDTSTDYDEWTSPSEGLGSDETYTTKGLMLRNMARGWNWIEGRSYFCGKPVIGPKLAQPVREQLDDLRADGWVIEPTTKINHRGKLVWRGMKVLTPSGQPSKYP